MKWLVVENRSRRSLNEPGHRDIGVLDPSVFDEVPLLDRPGLSDALAFVELVGAVLHYRVHQHEGFVDLQFAFPGFVLSSPGLHDLFLSLRNSQIIPLVSPWPTKVFKALHLALELPLTLQIQRQPSGHLHPPPDQILSDSVRILLDVLFLGIVELPRAGERSQFVLFVNGSEPTGCFSISHPFYGLLLSQLNLVDWIH